MAGTSAAAGAGAHPEGREGGPTLEANKAVVRRFIEEVLNGQRHALLDELCTPDHVLYHPALPQTARGMAETKAATRGVFGAFSALQFTIVDMVAETDRVAVRFTVAGTMSAQGAGGAAAAGKRIRGTGITVYRVRDGKVAGATIQEDILNMLHQSGLVPRNLTLLYWMNRLGVVRLLQRLGKIPAGAPLEDVSTQPGTSARP